MMNLKRILNAPFCILTFTLLGSSQAWAVPAPPLEMNSAKLESTVRVRLHEDTPQAQIRGFDLRISEQAAFSAPASAREVGWRRVAQPDRMSEWSFTCKGPKIIAKQKRIRRSLSLDESPSELSLKSPVQIRSLAGFLSYSGRPYREELRVFSKGKHCEVVNHVEVEKYLDGLVNSEFSSQWNEEAVAAQVVAARTYAVHQIRQARRNPQSTYDVDATVRDQVYDGSIKEDYRASRAVARTRGVILMAHELNQWVPLKAFYHSTCGGSTELPKSVWGRDFAGLQKRVSCPFCKSSPRFQWQQEFQAGEIASLLKKGAERDGIPKGWTQPMIESVRSGILMGLTAEMDRVSGRVAVLQTYWRPQGRRGIQVRVPVPGALFRNWIGTTKVRSTAFQVYPQIARGQGVRFRLEGRGNGHGVGMCQWGAKVMGEKGFNMNRILAHYYPSAQLRKLW